MELGIGRRVYWTEKRYWSTHHPEESGECDMRIEGVVISFDDNVAVVQAHYSLSEGGPRLVIRPVNKLNLCH